MEKSSLAAEDYTVALICALDVELAPTEAMLDEEHPQLSGKAGDTNSYSLGRIGQHNVVIACLPSGTYGTTAASNVAINLMRSFPNVRFGLMVGIGGAAHIADDEPENELRLGDIVVSSPQADHGGVVQYDFGKLVAEGHFVQTGILNKPPTVLSTAITRLRAQARKKGYALEKHLNKMFKDYPKMVREYSRPSSDTDRLYKKEYYHQGAAANCRECSQDHVIQREARSDDDPIVHYGLIGSANQVLKNPEARDRLHQEKGIICFEMEAAGLMNDFQCLVIRGICDYCDSHKNKKWQPYAAAVAAALAKELLLGIASYQVNDAPQARGIENTNSQPIQTGSSVALQCLRALRTTDPRDDKNRIESANGGLYAEACRWVLENDSYKQWKAEPNSRLLHIKGEPGKGKTMIVCGIINDLLSSFGAYFFFQETDVRINNATSALRGLIYMLADQNRQLLRHVQASYERAGRELFTDRNSWHALRAIFEEILKELESVETVIVIDAINECIIDRDKLLELIYHCNMNYKVKWIVSSRGWPDIDRHLKKCPTRVRLSLKFNKVSIEDAIDKYIKHRVSLLAEHQQYNSETEASVAKHLLNNANGTFLWVSLVCDTLEKIRPSATIASLNQFPADLNHLYKRMLERVLAEDKDGYLREILAVATALFRPVTIPELLTLTAFPQELTSNITELKNLVRECGGFLSIRESTIEFVHQSAKEYILQKAEKKVFPRGIHQMHLEIYYRLTGSLSKTLKRDIFELDSLNNAAISLNEVRKPNPNPLNGIEYACFYWSRHLVLGISQKDSEDKVLRTCLQFLERHLLHWIEAMTFFEGIPQAIGRLYELESQQLIQCFPTLRNFVHDAHRFVLTFGEMLTKYPLQIYSSGVVFTPTNSVIKQAFAGHEPDWVKVRMNAEVEWSENVTRIWSHDSAITAIAYSSDGYHFVCGFEDGMLELWNIVSGVMQRRINVASMPDFNNNLRTVVRRRSWPRYFHSDKPPTSLDLAEEDTNNDDDDDSKSVQSEDGVISLKQDLAASDMLASPISSEPKGLDAINREMSITDLAFHEDEGGVIFVIDGRQVGFWNTRTDEVKRRPEFDAPSTPLVMSVHGKYMAYGIDSPFVTLYSTKPGFQKRILRGQFDDISLITFSPDGELLACCSRKGLIQVWSASSGISLGSFDASDEEITALIVFPDGKRLVTAKRSSDGSEAVTMLHRSSGTHYWSLESDCKRLCLSPDGEHLVLVRKGHTLFYNTSDGKVLKDLNDKQDSLCVFSPNGEQLATTDSGGIRLFAIHDTKSLPDMIAPAKISSVRRTHFADDSRLLAMESQGMLLLTYNTKRDRIQGGERFPDSYISAASTAEPLFAYVTEGSHTVTLLNLKTLSSESKLDLPHSSGKATEMSFSPDGKFLAIGTIDALLCVWDLTTRSKILDIGDKVSTVPVRCLLWSTTGTRLAVRFDNESIGVWDLSNQRQLLFSKILTLEDNLLCMALSPDGCCLVTTHARIFEIWDVDRGFMTTRVLDSRMDADIPKYFSMALSHDKQKLACASAAGLELWNLSSRTLLHSLDMSLSSFKKMSFCQEDTALRLESGILDIRATTANAGTLTLLLGSESDIFCTKDWIYKDNRPLMWLPDAYRSAQTKYQDKRLVLHHDSGRIALLEFEDPLNKANKNESEFPSPISRAPTLGNMEALQIGYPLPKDQQWADFRNHHLTKWSPYNDMTMVPQAKRELYLPLSSKSSSTLAQPA